jgi:GTPase
VGEADLLLHVVDGSHPDPEGQIAAVREVLADVQARHVPELVVVNKADAADPEVVARLCRREPSAIVVSARTGEGLAELSGRIAELLPRPDVEVQVLVPYDRGDLVSRAYGDGEVLSERHTETGTRLHAKVEPSLAADLAPYAV